MKAKFTKIAGMAVIAAILLTGCSSLYKPESNHGRGQDYSKAEASIEAIAGVEDAAFTVEEWYNPGEGGLFASGGLNFYLRVTIEDGYRVADNAQLLRFLSETVWSVNNNSPKGSVTIEIIGGVDENYNWADAAKATYGKVNTSYPYASITENTISTRDDVYRKIYGDWPINPREFDTSKLIEKGELVVLDAAPAVDLDVTWYGLGNEYYLSISGDRSVLKDGEIYTGDITVKFYKKGSDEVIETVVDSYDEFYENGDPNRYPLALSDVKTFIGNKSFDEEDYSASLTFEAQSGFDTNPIILE